jgi:hypothetical protein
LGTKSYLITSLIVTDDEQLLLNETAPGQIVHVGGDGNCLMRAISHSITGTENEHLRIRALICDFIVENSLLLGEFFFNGENGLRYLMRTNMFSSGDPEKGVPGTYGMQLEIAAAANLFSIPIYVFHDVHPSKDSYWIRVVAGGSLGSKESSYAWTLDKVQVVFSGP